ncbi:hypothetical protein GCM10010411_92780 [Actinomadura fulvescens]|uniref:Uncharacterized protein n=1 Tax=Actinomadura fulvescens TaxID=46160 RepID=A0ABN3QYE4_9ACTN
MLDQAFGDGEVGGDVADPGVGARVASRRMLGGRERPSAGVLGPLTGSAWSAAENRTSSEKRCAKRYSRIIFLIRLIEAEPTPYVFA